MEPGSPLFAHDIPGKVFCDQRSVRGGLQNVGNELKKPKWFLADQGLFHLDSVHQKFFTSGWVEFIYRHASVPFAATRAPLKQKLDNPGTISVIACPSI